jgi:hypothetical protein
VIDPEILTGIHFIGNPSKFETFLHSF